MDYGPEVTEYADKRVGVYGGKFYPFHRGHLSFILKAQSMVDILFVVVQYDEAHERSLLTSGSKLDWIDPRTREAWISETLKAFPNIRVISQYERRSEAHMSDPILVEKYAELETMVGGHIDVVFSNTHEYDDYFAKLLPKSEHIVFYEERPIFTIEATRIRNEGVYKHWDFLPRPVQNFYTKRIAVVGIESSGKSHISSMLGSLYETEVVKEYGRTYYDNKNSYTSIDDPMDYVNIAVGHCHLLNESVARSNKILFSDTDLVYTQFFHEQSYGTKHPVLDALIKAKADKINTWIWLESHNPHELDGTRLALTQEERQSNRDKLFALYAYYGIQLEIVDEIDRDARFQKCTKIVDSLLA
jgi:HTH-type transcriptional repressor of NAD biosynthesis genes